MHIFVLNNLACISDACFNIIPWKLRVIFARNIVEGNTSFNKFQNHVDRNSGSFNARLATKNLRVWNYMSFHYYLSSISFCHPWLIISFEIDENNIKSAFHKLFCFSPNATNISARCSYLWIHNKLRPQKEWIGDWPTCNGHQLPFQY